jgi:16S rRNA (cytosine1402-N4)-methyltransferase
LTVNRRKVSNQEEPKGNHISVMLMEVLNLLEPKTGGVYLDCTFGRGGHTKAILESCDCKVIAIDRDSRAIETASEIKEIYGERFQFYHSLFSDVPNVFKSAGIEQVDGVLLDLGLSSPQIDDAEAGFSYMKNGPLDMGMGLNYHDNYKNETPERYRKNSATFVKKKKNNAFDLLDHNSYTSANNGYEYIHTAEVYNVRNDARKKNDEQKKQLTAATIINSATDEEIAKILKIYGEERHSMKIAMAIVEVRKKTGPIQTTGALSEIIKKVVGPQFAIKACSRVFQALRIYVNNEIGELIKFLSFMSDLLKHGGVFAAISFHSLEDRIIKQFLKYNYLPTHVNLLSNAANVSDKISGKRLDALSTDFGSAHFRNNDRHSMFNILNIANDTLLEQHLWDQSAYDENYENENDSESLDTDSANIENALISEITKQHEQSILLPNDECVYSFADKLTNKAISNVRRIIVSNNEARKNVRARSAILRSCIKK